MKRLRVVCWAAIVGLAVALGACGSEQTTVVRVDIADPEDRAKFIEVLQKTDRQFAYDSEGRLLVQAESIEELKSATREYSAWQQTKWDIVDADALAED